MYSGTTVGKKSGHVIGAHQRIDRIARRHITPFLTKSLPFPSIKDILHFEGNNGPDGIKRKSPSKDEPWHYINPNQPHDRALIDMVLDHQVNLAKALKTKNNERAAFEAAWMAHAIVDGLTPAHHYPFADKVEELFGIPHYERTSVKTKNVIKGINRRDTISKNWEYWGRHGVMMNHFTFEMGVALSILGNGFSKEIVTKDDLKRLKTVGYEVMFQEILVAVFELKTYDKFSKKGWDWRLAKVVRTQLIPLIIKAVILGWVYFSRKGKEMNVRIIAGELGGRIIEGSGTDRTHPMSERIRNAIFNKIADEVEGAKVLDAFAGSGVIGLEALSRGAHSLVLVEKDRIAQKIIQKNIDKLGVNAKAHLIKANVAGWSNTTEESFDIIFADPPYHDPQLSTVSRLFALLKPNGLMVLSYPGRGEMPTETGVVVVDNRSYGTAALAYYRKKDA